jgi:hypothetical protein
MMFIHETPPDSRIEHLAQNNPSFDGFRFVPLVTKDLELCCAIEILFLRSGPPGKVFESGDVDNRIKTILDALKVPRQLQDLGEYKDQPLGPDENPMFCLLEDDGLVSKFAVETDQLLEPIAGGIPSISDARIVVTVNLRPARVTIANLCFG